MKYEAPRVIVLGSALSGIQGEPKDDNHIDGPPALGTASAYEADE